MKFGDEYIIKADKAAATLYGLALGDALGMPSQTLSIEEIRLKYGSIEDFISPYSGHPVSEGLNAAQVTDDTEQALLLARRLINCPSKFDASAWARDLLSWEENVKSRGLLDILGPSSKAALQAIRQGVDPGEAAKNGTTNGAAMRIAPIGIMFSESNIDALVDAVEETCRVTHNTGEAIAAAAAVAGYISSRISGSDDDQAFEFALLAAKLGQQRGHPNGVSNLADLIEQAVDLAESQIKPDAFSEIVGTSVDSCQSVPAAFGIMRMSGGNIWQTGLIAANLGDDTDTIGAIACSMCGAGSGKKSIPADKLERLLSANDLEIDSISKELVNLRLCKSSEQGRVVT